MVLLQSKLRPDDSHSAGIVSDEGDQEPRRCSKATLFGVRSGDECDASERSPKSASIGSIEPCRLRSASRNERSGQTVMLRDARHQDSIGGQLTLQLRVRTEPIGGGRRQRMSRERLPPLSLTSVKSDR
jgi:hypothetical protein